jgi:hypothetical protein
VITIAACHFDEKTAISAGILKAESREAWEKIERGDGDGR